VPAAAFDEAFAELPSLAQSRFDTPQVAVKDKAISPRLDPQSSSAKGDLVLNRLAAQVANLDRQCGQLMQLLHSLEGENERLAR
jgi:hypothetical protein